jgi:hypothetical protein
MSQAMMKPAAIAALCGGLLCAGSALAQNATTAAPERFGNDHDDPRTAYPALAGGEAKACTVQVLRHGFTNFEPARATLDAARQCPGPWSRIVLRIDGQVKGRQYDRIGHASVGGITVFRTSTPEPSREGITWQVEKDVTAYAPLFTSAQPVELHIGNVIDDVHTGVFDVALSFDFYAGEAAADTADQVLALQGLREDHADTVGTAAIPENTRRLVAEVYATGSGGGCEEFWYFATEADGYWCRGKQGPYREVQVLVDGKLAGIAAPYPHIYTGGWSNPFLWYAIPAPRAFDIAPIRYELTPFIGLLNDGKPHEVRFRVAGLQAGTDGWKLMPNLQVWRDVGSQRVRAELLEVDAGDASFDGDLDARDPQQQRMHQRWQRRFAARGAVHTSRGRVETQVARAIEGDIHHRWTAQEDGDDHLLAQWRDVETITRTPARGEATAITLDQRFGLDGVLLTTPVGGNPRLTTTLDIHDDARRTTSQGEVSTWTQTRDRFIGTASWTGKVPREQRNATAHTAQTYRVETSSGSCTQRRIENRNGRFIADASGCPAPAAAAEPPKP